MDEDQPIAGPSGSRHEFAEPERAPESEQGFSPGSDEEPEDNESEGEQDQIQLQPAENEIEGDFECVRFICRSNES